MGNVLQPTPHSNAKAPCLIAEFVDISRAVRGLFDPYRPERHYMRGPGPKWHAKHNLRADSADPLAADCALQVG
jgi:hypothetical protein